MNLDQSKISKADKVLEGVATFWFIVAVIGQWMFVYYIAIHYGGAGIHGDYAALKNTSIKGYVSGDTFGNLFYAAHMLMAAIITFGGTLQLIPQIRNRAISFHRWNGRLFILTAFAISLDGLYLISVDPNFEKLT